MSNNIGSLYSANGRLVLVTQGLTGALLVAGKQCLFRVLLTQFEIGRVDRIIATITRPAPLAKTAIVLPRAYLRVEATAPLGPSVGVEIRGYAFPKSGSYEVGLLVEDAGGATIASVSLQFEFTATRDLRVLVVPLQGSAPGRNFLPTPEWYVDIANSMDRLGSMLPVRDCVRDALNGSRRQGLRYHVGAPKEAWPEEVGLKSVDYWKEASEINAAAGPNDDKVDVTVLFRPHQLDEDPNGSAIYCSAQQRQAQAIGGSWNGVEMTAPTFAQEIGHTLCLEPPSSPWYDGGAHSNAGSITDPFAYDFVNHRPFPAPGHYLGDVMGWGAWQGADSVAFSVFDWDYLLTQRFPTILSTGSDINPTTTDPCGRIEYKPPFPSGAPKPPATWHRIIGSRADGPNWVWGPHGPVPGPVGPLHRGKPASPPIQALLRALERLQAARVREVHLPFEEAPITIATLAFPSLHTTGRVEMGHREHRRAGGQTQKKHARSRSGRSK